jgi:hypothetical protein
MTKLRLVTLIALAACGNKKDAPPAAASGSAPAGTAAAPAGTAAAPAGTAAGKCSFTVTGDVSLTVEGIATKSPPNGKAMAAADYWMTEAQVRAGLTTLAGLDSKKSKDQVAAEVEQNMKRDPRVMLLALNCGADQGAIIFGPGKDSKYADVPMKPGKYVVTHDAKAGQFGAMVNLRPPSGHQSFSISEPGTLDITKFDLTGIAGTFAFKGTSFDGKHAIDVQGSFDFPCVGEACQK